MYPIYCTVPFGTLFLPDLALTSGHSSYKSCHSTLTAHFCIRPSTLTTLLHRVIHIDQTLHLAIFHLILQQWQMHLSLFSWSALLQIASINLYCSELWMQVMRAVPGQSGGHTIWRRSGLLSNISTQLSPLDGLIAVPVLLWGFHTFITGAGRR